MARSVPRLLLCRPSGEPLDAEPALDARSPHDLRRPFPAAVLFLAVIAAAVFVVAGRATAPQPVPWSAGLAAGFGFDRNLTEPAPPPRAAVKSASPPGPCIALVFDDLGYTVSGLAAEMLDLPPEVTFAVLPGLPASAEFARAAAARGHEILLHLPMEPVDTHRHDPGHDALFVELAPDENLVRLRRQLDGLTGYVGVSNHMGSRFTSRADLMTPVLREIRRRGDGLFFLDSSTTPSSMVGTAARSTGLPYLENNLFLDGGDEGSGPPAVRADRVAGVALRRGHAVAIGHVKRETVDAVRAAIDRWEAQGIRLVRLSELVSR